MPFINRKKLNNMKTQKIDDCLRQFEDLSESLKVICSQANMLGRCLDSLKDIVNPEVIGGEQIKKKFNKEKSTSHLEDSLNECTKIMISVCENIKKEAVEVFDNFITQVILPNDDEIKGIQEHNSQIVVKFHEAFYSMFNHFLVLCAENLESFLICSDCRTPIGFSHHSKCIALSVVKPNIWRKTKYDDKFITYGMKFNFYDIVSPEYRQSIVQKIKKTCWEQQIHARHQLLRTTKSKPFMSKSWPTRWLRGDGDRNRDEKKEHKIVRFQHQQQAMTTTTTTKSSTTTTMMIANLESPPSLESSSSSWTQVQKDIKTLPTTKLEITTFAEQFKLDKLF